VPFGRADDAFNQAALHRREKHREHDRQPPQQLRPAIDPARVSYRKRR
jgi:hypothetical protein